MHGKNVLFMIFLFLVTKPTCYAPRGPGRPCSVGTESYAQLRRTVTLPLTKSSIIAGDERFFLRKSVGNLCCNGAAACYIGPAKMQGNGLYSSMPLGSGGKSYF